MESPEEVDRVQRQVLGLRRAYGQIKGIKERQSAGRLTSADRRVIRGWRRGWIRVRNPA